MSQRRDAAVSPGPLTLYTSASPELRAAIDQLRAELGRVDTPTATAAARRLLRQHLLRHTEVLASALAEEMA